MSMKAESWLIRTGQTWRLVVSLLILRVGVASGFVGLSCEDCGLVVRSLLGGGAPLLGIGLFVLLLSAARAARGVDAAQWWTFCSSAAGTTKDAGSCS
jgi:hypothetical protein